MKLNELRDKALEIANKRGWNQGSYKHYICLIVSELMEAVEAYRKNKHSKVDLYLKHTDRSECLECIQRWGEDFYSGNAGIVMGAFITFIKGTVEEELADTFIRLLHLAGLNNIDLGISRVTPYYTPSEYDTFTEWAFDVVSDLVNNDCDTKETILNGLSHIMGYCDYYKIDLELHIREKMRYLEVSYIDKVNEQCNLNHA